MTDTFSASRVFTMADQEAFARQSGDRNPIHVDRIAARRTQAGAPVVHGVHGVLWALDQLSRAGFPIGNVRSVKAQFPKFVFLETEVSVRIARQNEQALKVELVADGVVTTIVDIKFGPCSEASLASFTDLPDIGRLDEPLPLTFADMETSNGWLSTGDERDIETRFPSLSSALGPQRVLAMAQLSTLVGMACPGLHSIFSGFSIDIVDELGARQGIGWRTLRTDERFRLVTMAAGGMGISAQVQAFMRTEPVDPPSLEKLADIVGDQEFAERTALIIGGSRGLGAVTAKLLAAGGARVFLTYATGKADAEQLVQDICAARGSEKAAALRYDAYGDANAQLAALPTIITHIYYFATPRIAHQTPLTYARPRFDTFASVYLDGFAKIVTWAAAHLSDKPRAILYPSTVFIDERPRGMTEYAMTKAAGEILAADLASTLGLTITAPRIPRVLTDQTATLLALQTEDPVAVMLPLLRAEP